MKINGYKRILDYYKHCEVHVPSLFAARYQTIPNVYEYGISLNKKTFIDEVILKYEVKADEILYNESFNGNDESNSTLDAIIFIKNGFVVATEHEDLTLFYDATIGSDERQQLIELAKKHIKHKEEKKFFHMVCRDNSDMYLQDFEIKNHHVDLESHYNDDFIKIDNLIKTTLNEKGKNGIILLHGMFGTGKTYYIRHLINTINRKFIYFPLYMIDAISSPEFLPFITEHPHSILILEDCENLLMHRNSGNTNNNALSNLLNIGDGLLSDALSVNVICTFNANVSKIDDAILRKGRMLARYEFGELTKEKTIKLSEKLGKQLTEPKPMTVADIYNLNNNDFQDSKVTKIGFTQNRN